MSLLLCHFLPKDAIDRTHLFLAITLNSNLQRFSHKNSQHWAGLPWLFRKLNLRHLPKIRLHRSTINDQTVQCQTTPDRRRLPPIRFPTEGLAAAAPPPPPPSINFFSRVLFLLSLWISFFLRQLPDGTTFFAVPLHCLSAPVDHHDHHHHHSSEWVECKWNSHWTAWYARHRLNHRHSSWSAVPTCRYAQASWWVEWFVNKLSHIIGSWMCGEEADLRSHITIGNVINLPSDVGLRMRYFCNKNNTVQH